jgi:hypothetical protein
MLRPGLRRTTGATSFEAKPAAAVFRLGEVGGAGRDRTGDLLNANQALSQLSYSPWEFDGWWAWVDSNYRPHPYQGCALTN